jgi:hypothetical protein
MFYLFDAGVFMLFCGLYCIVFTIYWVVEIAPDLAIGKSGVFCALITCWILSILFWCVYLVLAWLGSAAIAMSHLWVMGPFLPSVPSRASPAPGGWDHSRGSLWKGHLHGSSKVFGWWHPRGLGASRKFGIWEGVDPSDFLLLDNVWLRWWYRSRAQQACHEVFPCQGHMLNGQCYGLHAEGVNASACPSAGECSG